MLESGHEIQASRPHRRSGLPALLRHHVVRGRCRRADVSSDVQGGARRRNQLLRHRQRVQQGRVRRDPRPAGKGAPQRPGDHHQGQRPDPSRSQCARHLAPPHDRGDRGLPAAPADRSHRRAVPAPLRRAGADRGVDARPGGPGARGQGDLSRRQQLVGMADPARGRPAGAPQLGAPAGHPADVQPREAPGRGRDPADGRA